MATGTPLFTQYTDRYGFYYIAGKRYQVVPNRYDRCVVLKNVTYPLKLNDFSYDSKVISLTIVDQMSGCVLIRGKKVQKKGTVITYKKGSKNSATLYVLIVPLVCVKLHTWFVKDGDDATSITPPVNNSGLVSQLNRIYFWQAGVWFSPGKVIDTSKKKLAKIDGIDFSTTGQTQDQQNEIWRKLRSAAKKEGTQNSGNINVFFVKKWAARDTAPVCTAGACTGGKNVTGTAGAKIGDNLTVIEQEIGTTLPFTLMAHELGHNLGAEHDKEHSNFLMDHFINSNTQILSLASIGGMHKIWT